MSDIWIAFLVIAFVILPVSIFGVIILLRLINKEQPNPFKNKFKCVLLKHIWIKRLPHRLYQVNFYDCSRCGKQKLSGYGYHDEFWEEA